jgi:transposase
MPEVIIEERVLRRRFTAEQKLVIVQASLEAGALLAEVARKYRVGVSTLIKWRKNAIEGSLMSIKDNKPAVPANEVKKLEREIKQLRQLLGKKSLQVELLQEAVEIAREKKLISRQFLPGVDDIVKE